MSRTRQSKPNRSRTVASNVAAVVDRAVVAVNSNHAVRKVVRSLVTRSPQKNRLVVSAMPNRQANNNVAAVRVNLPLRGNLLCRAMPGMRLMTNTKLPDALRLSGLRELCNILNVHVFVGRIRRSPPHPAFLAKHLSAICERGKRFLCFNAHKATRCVTSPQPIVRATPLKGTPGDSCPDHYRHLPSKHHFAYAQPVCGRGCPQRVYAVLHVVRI